MSHVVICLCCKNKFDRDKEKYCVVGRRYIHADCMLQEAEKNPNYVKKEIIDPTDKVVCIYCKKPLSKKDDDCIKIDEKKFAHSLCVEKEKLRERSDKEKLEDYIKELFNISYIEPRVKNQIKKFIEEYDYTYSGMHKALYYFYEIKNGDKSKANNGIGIIPYVYKDAYNYFYNLWLIQQKNQGIQPELCQPKIKEVTIPRPERKVKKRSLFEFLDEEEK